MTAPLIGLLGAIAGALLTGTINWWQTRRTTDVRRRAATRFVETELRLNAGRLQWLGETLMPDALGDVSPAERRDALVLFGEVPAPTAWVNHQQLLAETLNSEQWYSIAQAYEAIETLRHPVTADAMSQHNNSLLSQAMDGYMVAMWGRRVIDGARLASTLAGAQPIGGMEPGGFHDEMLGSLRGSVAASPPTLGDNADQDS